MAPSETMLLMGWGSCNICQLHTPADIHLDNIMQPVTPYVCCRPAMLQQVTSLFNAAVTTFQWGGGGVILHHNTCFSCLFEDNMFLYLLHLQISTKHQKQTLMLRKIWRNNFGGEIIYLPSPSKGNGCQPALLPELFIALLKLPVTCNKYNE